MSSEVGQDPHIPAIINLSTRVNARGIIHSRFTSRLANLKYRVKVHGK